MTTQLTAEHIERIIELRDHLIEMGPDRFDMNDWFIKADTTRVHDTMDWFDLTGHIDKARDIINHNSCGTAACLAGHAAILWGDEFGHNTTTAHVARWLGMDIGVEPWQCKTWFATQGWPDFARIPWLNRQLDLSTLDYDPEHELEQSFIRRGIEHHIVLDVMDDLIHGRRLHWYDDDTSAADIADRQDAQ